MQAQPYDAEKHNKDPDGNNQEWAHVIVKLSLGLFLGRFGTDHYKDSQYNLIVIKLSH